MLTGTRSAVTVHTSVVRLSHHGTCEPRYCWLFLEHRRDVMCGCWESGYADRLSYSRTRGPVYSLRADTCPTNSDRLSQRLLYIGPWRVMRNGRRDGKSTSTARPPSGRSDARAATGADMKYIAPWMRGVSTTQARINVTNIDGLSQLRGNGCIFTPRR